MADDLNELMSDKAPLDPGGLGANLNQAQRQLMFNGIGQMGALLLAAGQRMMPAERAKYLAQLGAVPGQMQDQALKYQQMQMMDQYRRAQAQKLLMDTRLSEAQLKGLETAQGMITRLPDIFGGSPSAGGQSTGGAVANIAAGGGAPATPNSAPDGASMPSGSTAPGMSAAPAAAPVASTGASTSGGNWALYQKLMAQAGQMALTPATAHLAPILEKHAANVLGRDAWVPTTAANGLPAMKNVITGQIAALDQPRIERVLQPGPGGSMREALIPAHQAPGQTSALPPDIREVNIPGVGTQRVDLNSPERGQLGAPPLTLEQQVGSRVQSGVPAQGPAQQPTANPQGAPTGTSGGNQASVQTDPIAAMEEIRRASSVGTSIGEAQAKVAQNAPQAIESANRAMNLLNNVAKDPTLDRATGMLAFTSAVPGTGAYDFAAKVAQLRGSAFQEGIKMMVGLGALSDKEGAAALSSITRLDQRLSAREFRNALQELSGIVATGKARAEANLKLLPPGAPVVTGPPPSGQRPAGRWNIEKGEWE